MDLTIDKNIIDKDEYPQTAELEIALRRTCWPTCGIRPRREHARHLDDRVSEAAMLGGMALLWNVAARRRRPARPPTSPTS
jgi:glutamate decarboxylase